MKIQDYIDIIEKTAVYPKEFGLGYCALGLVDEIDELLDALEDQESTTYTKKVKKEAGDVYWYITAICGETGISAKSILSSSASNFLDSVDVIEEDRYESMQKKLISKASKIAGIVKKYYRDADTDQKREEYIDKNYDELFLLLTQTGILTSEMCRYNQIKFSNVLEANYEKLTRRRETNTLHGSGDDREEKK